MKRWRGEKKGKTWKFNSPNTRGENGKEKNKDRRKKRGRRGKKGRDRRPTVRAEWR